VLDRIAYYSKRANLVRPERPAQLRHQDVRPGEDGRFGSAGLFAGGKFAVADQKTEPGSRAAHFLFDNEVDRQMRSIALIAFVLVAVTAIMEPGPVESARVSRWGHLARDGALARLRGADSGRQADFSRSRLYYAAGALLVNGLGTEPARTIRTASLIFRPGHAGGGLPHARILSGSRPAVRLRVTRDQPRLLSARSHHRHRRGAAVLSITLAMLGFAWFAFAGQRRGREVLALGLAGAFLLQGLDRLRDPGRRHARLHLATRSPGLLWRTVSWARTAPPRRDRGDLATCARAARRRRPLARVLDENFGRYFGREGDVPTTSSRSTTISARALSRDALGTVLAVRDLRLVEGRSAAPSRSEIFLLCWGARWDDPAHRYR
jgi:hypothetical protein